MAPDVERLPTEQNGVGAKLLSNLLRGEQFKLFAVFPVEQFGSFVFKSQRGGAGACTAFPGKTWALPA
jgi:hypothetical protein